MNNQEQGVLLKNKVSHLFVKPLLLILLVLIQTITPTIAFSEDKQQSDLNAKKHHIFIFYSPESKLKSSISDSLSDALSQSELLSQANVTFSNHRVTENKKSLTIDRKNDVIVSIGRKSMEMAKLQYPNANKLFISTDTDTYKSYTKNNKKEAILYIAQPFCRQLGLVRAINKNWNSVSLLISQKKNIDKISFYKCARNFKLQLRIVKTDNNGSLSRSIKRALERSDILLAIPDKSIYNRKTVKNILLTSYRLRKPVIGFSNSFVKAGALASIHSNSEQIAISASHLIRDYFKGNQKFARTINYPHLFDVSINRQVFNALGIDVPDINKLKQEIIHTDAKSLGLSK